MGLALGLNYYVSYLLMNTVVTMSLLSMLSGIVMYGLSVIPWTAFFIFARQFGIYYYFLTEKETCVNIQKNIQSHCSTLGDGGKGSGYACGYWFLVYLNLSRNYEEMYAYVLCTKDSYDRLTEERDRLTLDTLSVVKHSIVEDKIQLLERYGSPSHYYYRKRDFTLDKDERPEQTAILDQIELDLKIQPYQTILLHGKQGTGKSMVGLFLARRLKGMFCNTMNPFEAGDTLHNIYSYGDVSKISPLVLMLDEIDVYLQKVKIGITPHKSLDILVKDKSAWNRMLDSIQKGMYKNLILILTMNETPESIHALDSSFIRFPRVNRSIQLKEMIFPEHDVEKN